MQVGAGLPHNSQAQRGELDGPCQWRLGCPKPGPGGVCVAAAKVPPAPPGGAMPPRVFGSIVATCCCRLMACPYYTCPQMGPYVAALRRHPCCCNACNTRLRVDWVYGGKTFGEQPRSKQSPDCSYSDLLSGDTNDWCFVGLEGSPKGGSGKAHADARVEMLGAITATIADKVGVGGIGAVAVEDGSYYLIKWTGTPGVSATGQSTCTGHWLAKIHDTRNWYQVVSNPEEQVQDMRHVTSAAVEVEAYPETNNLPPKAREHHLVEAGNLPVEINDSTHCYLLDEVRRRSNLEYDPEKYLMLDGPGGGDEASVGSASGSSSSGSSSSEQPSEDDDTNSECSSASGGSMQEG